MQMFPPAQQFQSFAPMPQMAMPFPVPHFGQPQFPFPPQQQPNMGRGVNGPCFICQQHGHVARNCPNNQNNRGGAQFRRGGFGAEGTLEESSIVKKRIDLLMPCV